MFSSAGIAAQLTETADRKEPGNCPALRCRALRSKVPAKRSHCNCPAMRQTINTFPDKSLGAPQHRLFAMEYYCRFCAGRADATPADFSRHRMRRNWLRYLRTPKNDGQKRAPSMSLTTNIPSGDETNRLHRWGYKHYNEMLFNARQLLGLELSARLITRSTTNASGTSGDESFGSVALSEHALPI